MSLLSSKNVITNFPSELSGRNTSAGVADSTAVCLNGPFSDIMGAEKQRALSLQL